MKASFLHDRYIEAGFAVALVNVRGTGASEGCMQFGGAVDRADAAAVVEALADEDWSNGNVAMVGHSYAAWSQYWALAAAAPALKAIIPASGIVDLWSYHTFKGAPVFFGPTFSTDWTGVAAVGLGGALGGAVPDTSPGHVACRRYGDDIVASAGTGLRGDRTTYYDERDLRNQIATSKVPVLITGGLASGQGYVQGGPTGAQPGESTLLQQLDGLWSSLKGDRRMLLGQWGHTYPVRADFPAMAVAWLDHYLRGGPEVVTPGVVEFEDDRGEWHAADRWPPESDKETLILTGATLRTVESIDSSMQTFQSVGTPCVGFCPVSDVSRAYPLATTGAPGPRFDYCVGDQALYTSAPLVSDVLLAGNFTLELTVTSSLADGNLVAFLWHTPGPGTCPDSGVKEIQRAIVSLRHWEDERGHDFPVGSPTTVTLRSLSFASVVPAGHRLILAIGGESWGLFPKMKPTFTVATGPGIAASLTLPVVEGDLEFGQ